RIRRVLRRQAPQAAAHGLVPARTFVFLEARRLSISPNVFGKRSFHLQVSGVRCQVSGFRFQASGSLTDWNLTPDTWNLKPDTCATNAPECDQSPAAPNPDRAPRRSSAPARGRK